MLSRDRPVAPALSRSASVDRSYGLSASASSSGSGAGSRSDRDGQWKVEAHSGAYGNCAFLVGASIKYNSVTHETTARDRIEGSPEQAVRRETVSHIVERWAAYNDQCGITTDQVGA
jgi:hypothetical protein